MANHVQNILLVEGQAIQAVRKYVQRSESLFDFTAILPLPNASLEERIRCWGTKENAIGAVFHEEDGSFSFRTLNAPPLPVIEQLSKSFRIVRLRCAGQMKGAEYAEKQPIGTVANNTASILPTVHAGRKNCMSFAGGNLCILKE